MTNENVYKYTNSTEILEFAEFIGKVVAVMVNFRSKPIKGRLTDMSPEYIYIERYDGTRNAIRRHTILGVISARDTMRVV
jgi:hypothetical protein